MSVFTLSRSDFLGFVYLDEFVLDTELVKGGNEFAGSSLTSDSTVNNKRKLWDASDVMTSSHYKRCACRGSKS